MSRNAKNDAKTIVFPCVLKTIISHTMRDDKTFTKNDKQIRAILRAKFNDAHVKNTSWIATNMREYDALRRAYDRAYDATLNNVKKVRTNTRKANTKTNVDVVTHDNVDA